MSFVAILFYCSIATFKAVILIKNHENKTEEAMNRGFFFPFFTFAKKEEEEEKKNGSVGR